MKEKNKQHQTHQNSFGSIFNGIWGFGAKCWETVSGSSNDVREAYSEQRKNAQSKLNDSDLTKKERKKYIKERDRATYGLENHFNQVGNLCVRAICAVGTGIFIANKLLSSKK